MGIAPHLMGLRASLLLVLGMLRVARGSVVRSIISPPRRSSVPIVQNHSEQGDTILDEARTRGGHVLTRRFARADYQNHCIRYASHHPGVGNLKQRRSIQDDRV